MAFIISNNFQTTFIPILYRFLGLKSQLNLSDKVAQAKSHYRYIIRKTDLFHCVYCLQVENRQL